MDLLIELALEREKFFKKHLGRGGTPTPERGERKEPKHPTNTNQGGGKGRRNLRAMNEVKPGADTPPLFYCKPVNDKRGPSLAPDCDHRSSCMLQMTRQQHTKDGKPVTHQDHFRCTITCGYCGKRRHYENEYHIKKRGSDKLKRQEVERQKTQTPTRSPPNGDKGGKGGGKGGPPNPQRRSSAPAATPPLAAGDPKKRPQGDNASPEGITPRRGDWPGWPSPSWLQGWMSSYLMRSRGAAPKRRTGFLDPRENWGSSSSSGA